MSTRWVFLTLALCASGGGCSLIHSGVHNLHLESCRAVDEFRVCCLYRKMGEHAWAILGKEDAPPDCGPDYTEGFLDGFVDYLEAGGHGEPPPLPPCRFRGGWDERFDQKAAQHWFAGFRHGAQVAKLSGYRERTLVPVKLPLPPPPPPPAPAIVPGPSQAPLLVPAPPAVNVPPSVPQMPPAREKEGNTEKEGPALPPPTDKEDAKEPLSAPLRMQPARLRLEEARVTALPEPLEISRVPAKQPPDEGEVAPPLQAPAAPVVRLMVKQPPPEPEAAVKQPLFPELSILTSPLPEQRRLDTRIYYDLWAVTPSSAKQPHSGPTP